MRWLVNLWAPIAVEALRAAGASNDTFWEPLAPDDLDPLVASGTGPWTSGRQLGARYGLQQSGHSRRLSRGVDLVMCRLGLT